jgi:hypothetical protein
MNIDPEIAPFYDVTFVFGSLVCCEGCKREPDYSSDHPRHTDENYLDQAIAMQQQGWTVDGLNANCPECSQQIGPR